ncbi:MAG: tripartite tricarboxylate transporter substrate-binding protein [Candidatus Binatia bacterium]
MLRLSRLIATLIAALVCISTPSFGQDSFFKGKTMRIIVGGPPGGGFDTYARMIAKVMPKHIPGAPTIIVDNMPGAGMMIAANHVYKVSKPDGLTIGHFTGSQTISQVLNQPGVEFDMRKFYYLGAPTADHFSCAFTKASGITSADAWLKLKRPAKMGAVGPGNLTDNTLRVLSTSTDLPIQLISGYKGTAPVRLAMEAGEIDGSCWGWDSIKSTWARAIDSGEGIVVLQAAPKAHPDLPKVPLAINFGKNQDAKQMIDVVIHGGNIFERTFLLGPGVPKDRAQLLKQALANTMKDADFLADAGKARLGVAPITGEELERRVNAFFKLPDDLKVKMKRVLYE